MNKHQNFTAMPIDPNEKGGLRAYYADPKALHVLLWCPNYERKYVIFDGEKFWLFHPDNWEGRVEFKGAIPYLCLCAAYSAFGRNLPFKIRDIDIDTINKFPHWQEYENSL